MDNETITSLYTTDEYITKNPDLHEHDSAWKIKKLLPFVDEFIKQFRANHVTLLDVGGGSGIILSELSKYIVGENAKSVRKYCLDLSPGMLEIQKSNNPDVHKIIQANISDSGISDGEVDLTLMIDVLEHVEDPQRVLREIARISDFALFKVPLENTFYYRLMDILTKGNFRKRIIKKIGHINVYDANSLTRLLERDCGEIIKKDYAGVYEYLFRDKDESKFSRAFNFLGYLVYKVCPRIAGKIFNDYLIVLVKCRHS
ncbi:class I SAM-dependent methyltransferase [Patescibacteria group bacterium]|nr:class I SAM-dependent methyltransferase [Patescibacteria group bacterium]MBU1895888.1 class I SAM-dependent methyltransferase [Patescibacteria group bacterium]